MRRGGASTPFLICCALWASLLACAARASAVPLVPTPGGAASPGNNSSQQHAPAAPAAAAALTHKPLAPVSGTDVALFLLVAVALFIASGAGVGGGVLVVPSLLIISSFSTIAAVALSNVTILSSSVASLLFNVPRRRTSLARGGGSGDNSSSGGGSGARPAPLIDWDLVLLFGPPTVAGSIAGSYINMVIPGWVTKCALFLLLVPMAWRMADKARAMYARESTARRQAAAARPVISFDAADIVAMPDVGGGSTAGRRPAMADEGGDGAANDVHCVQLPPPPPAAPSHGGGAPGAAAAVVVDVRGPGSQPAKDLEGGMLPPSCGAAGSKADGTPGGAAQCCRPWVGCCARRSEPQAGAAGCQAVRDRLEREQALLLPPLQVGLLALTLACVAGTSLLAGLLLTCGSWGFWLLSLSPLLAMVLVWAAARRHVLWKAAWKAQLGVRAAGDLAWTSWTTVLYPAICISAGIIAGLLGLGGGLVLGPLMLELGVDPAVSAASTQVALLISSSTSAVVYAVNGAVPWDYGCVLVAIGFLATLVGQWLVSWLVRRLGRPSVLVITLALMFAAATCAALAVVVMTAVDLARHPGALGARKGVCPAQASSH